MRQAFAQSNTDSPAMSLEVLCQPLNVCIVASFLVLAFALRYGNKRPRLPLPPGPKGLPLIGNLLDIPKDKPWETYNEWSKQYGTPKPSSVCFGCSPPAQPGDLVYFHALGQNFVVLNSLAAANDLLTLRAPNYSDRTESPVIDMYVLDYLRDPFAELA
jgi:hypothetical protein